MKLKEDIKIKWIDKLRSTPKDGQTMGRLRTLSGRVCAVGALYNLAAEEGIISQDWIVGELPLRTLGLWALQDFTESMTNWSDFLYLGSLRTDVMEANDAGVSWPVIADAIKNDL